MAIVVQAKNRNAPNNAGWLTNIVSVCQAPLFDKSMDPVEVCASSCDAFSAALTDAGDAVSSACAETATSDGANKSRPSQAIAKITATSAPAPNAATRQLNR